MQEDKEPLFGAVDTVRLALLALDGMISTTTFNTEAMAAQAASPYAAAPAPAEWLSRGVRFRDAHAVVGRSAPSPAARWVNRRYRSAAWC